MSLDPCCILTKNFACRHRVKANGVSYLIKFTQVLKLDARGASIWDAIDGQSNTGEVISIISTRLNLDYENTAKLVIAFIVKLTKYEFIDVQTASPSPVSIDTLCQHGVFSSVLEEMRQSHAMLDEITASKVSKRLVQILYETATQYDKSYADYDSYIAFLASLPEPAIRLHFNEELNFLSWRFSVSQHEVVMSFSDATYSGNVDHRR